MKFNSEDDAYEWWEEAYYFSGGYEEDFGEKMYMFYNWVDDQGVTWLDEETREFIEDWPL